VKSAFPDFSSLSLPFSRLISISPSRLPPNHLLENGKQVHEFFNSEPNPESSYGRGGGRVFRLKSMEQYSKEHNTNEQPSKQYFKASTLPEIIKGYAFAKKGAKQGDVDKGEFFSLPSPRFFRGGFSRTPFALGGKRNE